MPRNRNKYDVFPGSASPAALSASPPPSAAASAGNGSHVAPSASPPPPAAASAGKGSHAAPSASAPPSAAASAKRDPTTFFVGFAHALGRAGLPVDPVRTATFLSAVSALGAADPRGVYWAGRSTLAAQPDDLPIYDAVFATYFSGRAGRGLTPRQRTLQAPTVLLPSSSEGVDTGESGSEDEDTPIVKAKASGRDLLRRRDIARLGPEERAELAAMITLMRPGLPTRRSRRRYPSHLGTADRRRTIRAMLAVGGEPVRPPRHRVGTRPRRVVLLLDVSGSMEPYADPLLRFAHVLVRQRPAATEVFTIGTRLSRVTRALSQRDPDVALRQAGDVIPDFSGGTRLGEVLKAFNDRWGQRGTAHGAVVVIFSDGWERGSCDQLAEQTERLHRLARTVVWVNPHKGHDGYMPVQSGIVAALPYVDHFVAGHSLATLEELLEVIRGA